MAGGLSARQASRLLKEHGSYEAAIAARPDLADELGAVQRNGQQLRALLARASTPRPSSGFDPKKIAAARFERDVRVYETALARHARAERPQLSAKGEKRPSKKNAAGAPDTLYPQEEIKRALLLWRNRTTSPQHTSQSSIAREGFSRTAVRRVIRLDEHGAFELGPRDGLRLLGIDGEFRAAPTKVSLRALERALGLAPLA